MFKHLQPFFTLFLYDEHDIGFQEVKLMCYISFTAVFFFILTFHLVLVLKTHVHFTPFQCRCFFSPFSDMCRKKFFGSVLFPVLLEKKCHVTSTSNCHFETASCATCLFIVSLCFDDTGKEMCPKNS